MPTYQYECQKCGMTIERFLSISSFQDEMMGDCECGTEDNVVKWKCVITTPTEFRLKGKGWYESDGKNSATGSNQRRLA